MAYLQRHAYSVLSLESALSGLRDGSLPQSPVVITFDDGYYTTYSKALPHLTRYGFPATVYLITHAFVNGYPLFNYLVGYLLWKAEPGEIDLSALAVPGLGAVDYPASKMSKDLDWVQRKIVAYGEALDSEEERIQLCMRLAELVGQDYESLVSSRALNLVSEEEAQELEQAGVSIELHSHLHRFPGLPEEAGPAGQDMAENISQIEKVTGRRPTHFCYPYGMWSEQHWATLASFGIESATTCDRGLVFPEDNPYSLNRILDNERMSQVEFEALVSGFALSGKAVRRTLARVYDKLFGGQAAPSLAEKS